MNPHQRINIQYTIGLDELPTEVTRVYNKSVEQIRNIQLPDFSDEEILSSSVIKIIDEARQNLAKADLMLSDVQSIVNSYVEYEMSLTAEKSQPLTATPEMMDEDTGQSPD